MYSFIVQFCRLYINNFQVLDITLSQSPLQGENAAHFLQLKTFTQYQFFIHLVPITAAWTEAV